MERLPQPRVMFKSEKRRDPEPAAEVTATTDRHSATKSPTEDDKVCDENVEDETGEEENSVHLRGGGGNHYTSSRTRTVAKRVKRGSQGSRGSRGSRSSSGTYTSYSGSREKTYKRPVTADPRFRILCCTFM